MLTGYTKTITDLKKLFLKSVFAEAKTNIHSVYVFTHIVNFTDGFE